MKILNQWKILGAILLTGFVAVGSGCGSSATSASNYISNITVSSSTINGDIWATLNATLNTGSMILLSATIPVVDPSNTSIEYGSVSLVSNLCSSTSVCAGGGTLTISVNVTQVAHVKGTSNLLPNGTALPLGSAADAAVIGLPLGKTGATLYVGLGSGIAILGAALPFSALNTVGMYAPGVDIFDVFTIGKVVGDVGIFTGAAPNETGIAVFADLSSVINVSSTTTTTTTASSSVISSSLVARAITASDAATTTSASTTQPLLFQEVKPSSSEEQTVYYQLYRLSNQRARLQLK